MSRILNHLPGSADQVAQSIFELYKRQAEQVARTLDEAAQSRESEFRRGTVPATCLISITSGRGKPRVGGGAETSENMFKRDGDGWRICFEGVGGHYDNLDGFAYIHQLLRRRQDMG